MNERKKIGLVLSGGGALGFAHIGAIEVLIENNIPIDIVTGTSMGALVGGMFAGKGIDYLKEKIKTFKGTTIIDPSWFLFLEKGVFKGKKIVKYLEKNLGDMQVEDCPIKFGCIATDLETEEEYCFRQGRLVDAIRASIAVPGVFKPMELNGKSLYDGGLVNDFPVDLAKDMGADVIIGVFVDGYRHDEYKQKRTYEILLSAFSIMIDRACEKSKKQCDYLIDVIQPDIRHIDFFSKKKIAKSIEFGRKEMEKQMPTILAGLKEQGVID